MTVTGYLSHDELCNNRYIHISLFSGWDQGLLGMCVGEKRKLKIPSKLGYGAQGSPPTIPGKKDPLCGYSAS
jgi:hypothetical protein